MPRREETDRQTTHGRVLVETSGGPNRKDPTMPTGVSTHPARQGRSWNLILLVPLVVLITPLYNSDAPRLVGFPLFYWLPVLFIPLSVICVALVYRKTKNIDPAREPDATPGARR